MEGYQQIQVIGNGDYSQVFKMRRLLDNKIVVCKKIFYGQMNSKQKQHLVQQVNILRQLKSNHIVKYYEHIIDKINYNIYVIMEYCDGGDLETFLNTVTKQKISIPQECIWKIFMQILLAVYQIHKRKQGTILHRDIKPANIFLDSNQNVKLGDFGMAKKLNNQENFAKTKLKQTYYLSPEQLKQDLFTEKTDIWACGCLLYQMTALKLPFYGENQLQVALKIKSENYQPIPSHFSKQIQRVIRWCLSKNPNQRPNIDELINIPEIARRLRQRRLIDNTNILKKRQQQVIRKQRQLKQLEQKLNTKSKILNKEFSFNNQNINSKINIKV